MDYLKEAENGERLCIDELRVTDVVDFIKDLKADQDNYPLALCRIYYAGYSMGYKDASGILEAEKKSESENERIEIE